MDWRVRRILDNLWGPTGSILIHIVILVILATYVQIERPRQDEGIEAIVIEPTPMEELEKLTEELQKMEDLPQVVDVVTPPTVSLDQEPPAVDALGTTGDAAMDLSDFNMLETVSPVQFKGIIAGRSAAGRAEGLGKYSGGLGEQTERAVLKALAWLRDHQYPDGSWGPHYRAAMTGLALLAFLAHGETTASPEYGDAIRRGLRYLLRIQKDGWFRTGGPHWGPAQAPPQIHCYEHAIATYAISEAYALTGIPYLRIAMEDAVQVILDGQHEGGSWDYGYARGPDANMDVSLAGWHLQALEAALNAGAENRGLRTAIDTGIRGLTVLFDNSSGLFRYSTRERHGAPNVPMTGVAVLCMQLTGHAMDAEARAGVKALQNVPFRWTKTDPSTPNLDLRQVGAWPIYSWYYITQARFHQGGATWVSWNRQFAPTLCAMQNPDGSWGPAPASVEGTFGPVYCTALNALMLTVYYRFLPTYQPIKVEEKPPEPSKEEEFVIRFG
mgnify:CR=1 FL=1